MKKDFLVLTPEVRMEIAEKGKRLEDCLAPEVGEHLAALKNDCIEALYDSMDRCYSVEEQILALHLSQAPFMHSMGFESDLSPYEPWPIDSKMYFFHFIIGITHIKTKKRCRFAVNIEQSYTAADFERFRKDNIVLINLTKQDIRQNVGGCMAYITQIIENVFDI